MAQFDYQHHRCSPSLLIGPGDPHRVGSGGAFLGGDGYGGDAHVQLYLGARGGDAGERRGRIDGDGEDGARVGGHGLDEGALPQVKCC